MDQSELSLNYHGPIRIELKLEWTSYREGRSRSRFWCWTLPGPAWRWCCWLHSPKRAVKYFIKLISQIFRMCQLFLPDKQWWALVKTAGKLTAQTFAQSKICCVHQEKLILWRYQYCGRARGLMCNKAKDVLKTRKAIVRQENSACPLPR